MADGEISFPELKRQFIVLEEAAESARNEYVPHLESLWRYCDAAHVRKAKYLLTFGGEAVADAYAWIPHNPCFLTMLVSGFAMAARGQVMHVFLLRQLQNELIHAINHLCGEIPLASIWPRLISRGNFLRSTAKAMWRSASIWPRLISRGNQHLASQRAKLYDHR
jgi:hypothetical protein